MERWLGFGENCARRREGRDEWVLQLLGVVEGATRLGLEVRAPAMLPRGLGVQVTASGGWARAARDENCAAGLCGPDGLVWVLVG